MNMPIKAIPPIDQWASEAIKKSIADATPKTVETPEQIRAFNREVIKAAFKVTP